MSRKTDYETGGADTMLFVDWCGADGLGAFDMFGVQLPSQRHIMRLLAWRTTKRGSIRPNQTQAVIAHDTGLHRKTVNRALSALRTAGVLVGGERHSWAALDWSDAFKQAVKTHDVRPGAMGHSVTSMGHSVTSPMGHNVTSMGHSVTSMGHDVTYLTGEQVTEGYLTQQQTNIEDNDDDMSPNGDGETTQDVDDGILKKMVTTVPGAGIQRHEKHTSSQRAKEFADYAIQPLTSMGFVVRENTGEWIKAVERLERFYDSSDKTGRQLLSAIAGACEWAERKMESGDAKKRPEWFGPILSAAVSDYARTDRKFDRIHKLDGTLGWTIRSTGRD